MKKKQIQQHNEKYYSAVNDYYALKKKYDMRLKNKKKKKDYKELSTVEKQIEIKKFKQQRKCISCKKRGGSIFTETQNTLKVVCGTDTPCSLHIEITKPYHYFLPIAQKEINEEIEILKENLSRVKLDLLFELMEEEVGINEFETLRDELNEALEYKKVFRDGYHNLNKVIEINVKEDEVKDVLIKDYLIDLKQKYNQAVNTFKKNISEYKINNEIALLTDTIHMYKNILIPLQNKIREMKYQITYLKIDPEPPGPNPNKGPDNVAWNGDAPMPKFYLIPTKIAVKNLLIDGSEYKIIANKK